MKFAHRSKYFDLKNVNALKLYYIIKKYLEM